MRRASALGVSRAARIRSGRTGIPRCPHPIDELRWQERQEPSSWASLAEADEQGKGTMKLFSPKVFSPGDVPARGQVLSRRKVLGRFAAFAGGVAGSTVIGTVAVGSVRPRRPHRSVRDRQRRSGLPPVAPRHGSALRPGTFGASVSSEAPARTTPVTASSAERACSTATAGRSGRSTRAPSC